MNFVLRDYQQNCSDAVFNEWKEHQSTLVVMATGLGKTCTFADVVRRVQPMKALVLAHREELIFQARDKIEHITGLHCEIEMADMSAQSSLFHPTDAPVIISTIQTQCAGRNGARMTKFDPMQFGVVVVDESHHSTSDTYRRVLDYYKKNPDLRILGVTATPDRFDEEALGQIFNSVAFDYDILDGIHDGWLVPIEQRMVHIEGLDFSQVRTTAGDLNSADLAAVIEAEQNLQGMAGAAIEIIGDRRTIVFTASVKHAEMTANILNRHREGMAAWVCGTTPKEDRRQILADFENGKKQVVCNCGVLLEGFDNPAVEVIIMGRPTKSRSLYAQACGRSLRPLPGIVDGLSTSDERKAAIACSAKRRALIVDFVGNSGKHKLMTTADILGGKVSEEAVERATKQAELIGKEGGNVRMVELLDEAEDEIRKEKEKRRLADEARKARVIATVKYSSQLVNPFDVLDIKPIVGRGWDRGRELSEKQRGLLVKQGIDPDSVPYHQAKQLIGEVFRRWGSKQCTFKQAKVLRKYGYSGTMSMKEASATLDALAKNRWVKPQP